jgi:hypothetical protein
MFFFCFESIKEEENEIHLGVVHNPLSRPSRFFTVVFVNS